MPKLKTHRSAAKRYKVTASGKIMKRQAGIGHLLQHKSASRKRRIFKMVDVSESHVALVSKQHQENAEFSRWLTFLSHM